MKTSCNLLKEAADPTLRNLLGFILWVMWHLLHPPPTSYNTVVSIDDVLVIAQAASLWGPSDMRHDYEA